MRGACSLRPRSLVGIYDAAFEIVVSTPSVVVLSWLGAAPIAVLGVAIWYVGAEAVPFPGDVWLLALACALATAWRAVPAGAISRLVLDRLTGGATTGGRSPGITPPGQAAAAPPAPDARGAFTAALKRAPSLMAGGAVVLWALALSVPFLMLPMLFWGGVCLSGPLIMERVCPPWSVGGASRRLLGERASVAGGLTLVWLVALGVLTGNLVAFSGLVLFLARSLAHLDVGYLAVLLSPENPAFAPALIATAFLLLEPIRHTTIALMYADARVRREGLDLRAALDALPPPASRGDRRKGASRAAAGLLLVLVGLGATPARAETPASSEDAGIAHERQALDTLRPHLSPEDRAALDRLLRRVDADLDAGRHDAARRRLASARAEAEGEAVLGSGDVPAVDPRSLARDILARPEFQRVDRGDSQTVERPTSSWLERLFDWLERRSAPRDRRSRGGAGAEGVAAMGRILWGLLLVALAALIVWWVVRAFAARTLADEEDAVDDETGADGAPKRPGVLGLDPLSRSPDAWLAEADRLAAAGQYREALRATYLALLSRLHRARAIDYQPTRTNWDHARAFRGSDGDRRAFADLTRRFDRAWYGGRGVGADDYRRARQGALALGSPEEAAHG